MDWNDIGQIVWKLMNSPTVITLLAGGLLWLLNRLYAARPAWRAFEGTIIAGVKWAEKQIPDDSANTALSRLDTALVYVLKVYTATNGKNASARVTAELREGIQIIHAELEASGALANTKPPEG